MSKDLINLYHEVVLWMLKRDLLITLHLRIRVVATADLKLRVRMARDMKKSKNRRDKRLESNGGRGALRTRSGSFRGRLDLDDNLESVGDVTWLSLTPKSARKHSRQQPSIGNRPSRLSEFVFEDDFEDECQDEKGSDSEETDMGRKNKEDTNWPSMISDPGRATPLQRKWLSAMSDDKEEYIAKRFEQ